MKNADKLKVFLNDMEGVGDVGGGIRGTGRWLAGCKKFTDKCRQSFDACCGGGGGIKLLWGETNTTCQYKSGCTPAGETYKYPFPSCCGIKINCINNKCANKNK